MQTKPFHFSAVLEFIAYKLCIAKFKYLFDKTVNAHANHGEMLSMNIDVYYSVNKQCLVS